MEGKILSLPQNTTFILVALLQRLWLLVMDSVPIRVLTSLEHDKFLYGLWS